MDTSLSLLESLRVAPDQSAWQRLVELYSPLIRGWLRRQSVIEQDEDDLVQEVLTIVYRKVPEFHRNPQAGSFRKWLRTITVNCLRDAWRKQQHRPQATGSSGFHDVLDQLSDPESQLSKMWDLEHDQHVTRVLLEHIRPHFTEQTWQAFQGVVLLGRTASEVATELGVTENVVFIAKSRVLGRLRQVGTGLID